MNRPIKLAAAVLLAVAVFFLLRNLIEDDATEIRRLFAEVSELAAKTGPESVLASAQAGQALANRVDDPCELNVAGTHLQDTFTRREVRDIVVHSRTVFQTMQLTFRNLRISIDTPGTALVTVSAVFRATDRGGESYHDVRELDCTLHKIDGDWLFAYCGAAAVIERPATR